MLFFSALQFMAWQFDVGWLRRPLPLFPVIVPWIVMALLILPAHTSVPGRLVSQACQTVTMLAVVASINVFLSKLVRTPNLKADLARRPWESNLPVGAVAVG
jgi:hypothetical protein